MKIGKKSPRTENKVNQSEAGNGNRIDRLGGADALGVALAARGGRRWSDRERELYESSIADLTSLHYPVWRLIRRLQGNVFVSGLRVDGILGAPHLETGAPTPAFF